MTESENASNARNLADLLREHQVLSGAQLELALNDQEINDLPLEEILLVRGWISEDKLYEVAPWLKPGSKEKAPWDKGDAPKAASAPLSSPAGQKPIWKPSVIIETPPKPSADKPASGARSGDEKPAPKPQDLPKAPPQRPAGAPTTQTTPVETSYEENLKTYKETLRKILSTGQE